MHIVLILFFKKTQQCVALKLLVLLQVISYSSKIIGNRAEKAVRRSLPNLAFACAQSVQFELGLAKTWAAWMSHHFFTPRFGPPRSIGRVIRKRTRGHPKSHLPVLQYSFTLILSLHPKTKERTYLALNIFQMIFMNYLL